MPVELLAALRREGELLASTVTVVDLDATVPGLTWDARTVAVHTGAVHRWAADIVRRGLVTNETGGSSAFWPDRAADWSAVRISDWLKVGLDELVETVAKAPEDLRCFTFLPDVEPLTFWVRRQAHETAVHRADVESVGADQVITAYGTAFAQDGLAELVGGFALEPGFARRTAGSLLLRAVDGAAWRITFGGPVNDVVSGLAAELGAADATVTATSAQLYRWAWNRPADVTVAGDDRVVDLWRTVRIS